MKINKISIQDTTSNSRAIPVNTHFKGQNEVPKLVQPSPENIKAMYASGIEANSFVSKLIAPKYGNETLDSILERNCDLSTIQKQNAELRRDANEISCSFLSDEGIELLKNKRCYEVVQHQLAEGKYDGMNLEEADNYFRKGIQRLVDNGVIDDKTFVLIDTGHAIPMAAQLMDENNRSALGNVKGSFILGKSIFPDRTPNNQASTLYEIMTECSAGRNSSMALSYGDLIDKAYKNGSKGDGALFVGVDFHRTDVLDISKLPTIAELKKLGINKVVIAQEMPPISSFSATDAKKIYETITSEQAQKCLNQIRRAENAAAEGADRTAIKTYLDKANSMLSSSPIEQKYKNLELPDKKEIAKMMDKMQFGYNTKTSARCDVTEYLRALKKDSGGSVKIILEGVDLAKLKIFDLADIIKVQSKLALGETEEFIKVLKRLI